MKKTVQSPFIYYLLRMNKADGSTWDITLKIDIEAYIVSVENKVQVTTSTKPPAAIYTSVESSQIFKDIYFIIVYDFINRQSNNKYKDAVIRSLEKMSNGGTLTYRVNF